MSSRSKNGFTIVELMISVTIMAVITTIVVMNQSHYSEDAQLRNVANDISLSLREAQSSGISVREFNPGSNEFNDAYGDAFSILNDPASYIYFADRPAGGLAPNGIYDNNWICAIGGASECLKKTNLPTGFKITKLCQVTLPGSQRCGDGRVDVTFLRPSTQAAINFFDMSGNLLTVGNNYRGALIGLTSPSGKTLSVIIYTTGEITIQ